MGKKWNTLLISGAAIATFLCGIQIAAQRSAPPQRCLLALSKRDHTLAIVDAATLHVIARLPVGPDPHEVVASSDGTKAYVSIYGFGRYHVLSVLDLVAQKALPDVDTGALNGLCCANIQSRIENLKEFHQHSAPFPLLVHQRSPSAKNRP